ncbi:MAG: winged helix-turn-helix domain-containing protein [Myxococcales bacterium]|nr:winged helix-turn-helix domain-containing protein [Myxococcales bacterium]
MKEQYNRQESAEDAHRWTFLSNHAHVLVCVARDKDARVRDIAYKVGITERAVQRILNELEDAGTIVRERHGRRNHYRVCGELPLRHSLEAGCTVGRLLAALAPETEEE